MTPAGYYDVLAQFLILFPQFIEGIRFWWPAGNPQTIAVEMASGQMYVFVYKSESDWSLVAVGGPAPRRERSAKATRKRRGG